MGLRSEAGVGRASSLRRSPVKCQHPRDLGADQREAKIRVPPRHGKRLQLQGGSRGAGPRNWRRRKRRASPRSPRRRSSDHAQCRLLLGHHRSSFPWDRKPCFQPPPHPHCTLPHQLQALRHPREQGLAQSLCPPSQHTCPLPTRLTSHLAAACPAALYPGDVALGLFLLQVPSALLFLASLYRVLGAFPGLKGPQPHLNSDKPHWLTWPQQVWSVQGYIDPSMPHPSPNCHQVGFSVTFAPPYLDPALGWLESLGLQEVGHDGPPTLFSPGTQCSGRWGSHPSPG